ncbi:MAG: glycosyltransferase family 4 protein [Woeseiaceae bacterium]|nr:glycosyltransferase family 4 protein [Woeseiaceae bacterium]
MAIRSLCVTEGADLPTIATFIGMHNAGVEVTVVCPRSHANFERLEQAGVPVIEIPLKKNFDRDGASALRAELERGGYHIVHTFNSRALTNSLTAVKGLPIKVIAYRGIVGNLSFLDPMSWKRYLNPRIDRIVCVCEAIRRWFLEMKPRFLRMPESRPVTIHKGHDLAWYTDTPADLSEIGVPDGAFTIACTAAYRPRKGIEYLIEAVEKLPADIPAHIVLIGDMSSPKLAARLANSPVKDRVHLAGFRKDAPAWTAACNVFCLPSTKREGLARAIIEAMAYSVAPVVTDCGGSPELVVDGECGYVVPIRDAAALAEAFETLYRDSELRQRFGAAARERIAKHFRNEDTVAKTIALYEELVSAPD